MFGVWAKAQVWAIIPHLDNITLVPWAQQGVGHTKPEHAVLKLALRRNILLSPPPPPSVAMKPLMHLRVPPLSSLVNFCLLLFPQGVDVKLIGAISATSKGEFYICVISEVILFTNVFYSIFMTTGCLTCCVRNRLSILCIKCIMHSLLADSQYKA